jgi:tRNA (cmo5U34)-methyltransferase
MADATQVGDQLEVSDGTWSFSDGVAPTFLDHVRRSVPLYDVGHQLVTEVATLFVRPGGVGYELGSATGQLLRTLASASPRTRSASWIGVDCQPEMVERARRWCEGIENASVVVDDIATMDYRSCDFVVAYLTLGFLDPEPRTRALERVREALREGGGLFVFEKVLTADPRLHSLLDLLYFRFKRAAGLSAEEILNKADSLAGVLQPMTSEEQAELLRSAGFRSVVPVLKYLCFEGFVAVK